MTYTTPGTFLVNKTTGARVNKGDEVTSFRGDLAIIVGWQLRGGSSTGRVLVNIHGWETEYFPGVYDLAIVLQDPNRHEHQGRWSTSPDGGFRVCGECGYIDPDYYDGVAIGGVTPPDPMITVSGLDID